MAQIFQDGLSFSGFERNKVFASSGGKFIDLSDVSGADSEGDCRAACVADFDDDGDADLFVNAAQRQLHHLYRNDVGVGGGGRFVKVRLRATKGHASATGAIVKVVRGTRTEARTLECGGGFESQHADEIVFGLGQDADARIDVRWPGRGVESFGVVAANGRYLLVEGEGKPRDVPARTFSFANPGPAGLKLRVGDVFPALSVKALDGSPMSPAPAEGRKLLINIWATTCAACVAELPDLQRLNDDGGYRVTGLCLDAPGSEAKVAKVMAQRGARFTVGLLPSTEAAKVLDLEKASIPMTIVVGLDGRIERVLQGRIRPGSL